MPNPSPDSPERGAEQLADAVELHLLRAPFSAMNVAGIRTLLRGATGSSAASADLALNAMGRRQRLLGDRYPFRITSIAVQRNEGQRVSPYTTMLLQSWRSAPFRTPTLASARPRSPSSP